MFKYHFFNEFKQYELVKTEQELRNIDQTLSNVCISVFDHDYRSYEGFACIIAVYVTSGVVYIIDAIKFRDIITDLRLLRHSVNKIIHCRKCVERLKKDFGEIQAYQNFDFPETKIYIDWRIRPLPSELIDIICTNLTMMVECLNDNLPAEVHYPSLEDEFLVFTEKYGFPSNHEIAQNLFKLRQYLAKKNDESPNYIITDSQLCDLIVNNPTEIEEFDTLFQRMSPLLRLHAIDFLLILRRRSKAFSMAELKEIPNKAFSFRELEDMSTLKYRSFETRATFSSAPERDSESESSLVISE